MVKIKSQKESSLDNKLIKAALIIIPLFIGRNFNDPFNTAKLLPLLLIALSLLTLLIVNKKLVFMNRNLLDALILTLVFGLVLSWSNSDNLFIAFYGDTQRRLGLLTYLCLIIILISSYRLSKFFSFQSLQNIVIFLSSIFSIYGFFQSKGKDVFNWNNPYNSIILTLGNPNFASAMMGILGVILLGILLYKRYFILKIISAINLVLLLYLINHSDSRQGLIAFLIGAGAACTFALRSFNRNLWRIMIFIYVTIFTFAILGMLKIGPLSELIYKGSISVRGFYWRAAIKMFMENPIFGVGLDRYQYYFKVYRENAYSLNFGYDITSSNAHNVVLQLFATGGLVVGLPYVGLIFYLFFKSINLFLREHQKEKPIFIYFIFGAWIAWLAQCFISIENIGVSIWGWFLTGFLAKIVFLDYGQNYDLEPVKVKLKRNELKSLVFISISFLASLLIVSQVYIGETSALMARTYANSADKKLVIYYGNKALQSRILDENYKVEIAKNYLLSNFVNESELILKNVITEDNKNIEALQTLAWIYESKTDTLDAILIREKIRNLDPCGVPNLMQLGLLYKNNSEITKMGEVKAKILELAPQSDYASKALKFFVA